ncbi:hypothetical protein ACE38V_13810 [Cytobacillus sp. Hz8]|uniref:hypothetical protein n=1 Tax=Cytobacillus sp. Hz8 TaxID=3347168 RepID=UPI0035DB0AC1
MVKKVLSIIMTLLVLIGLTFGFSHSTDAKFFDYSFFIGLIASVVIWFFTSKGGFTSRSVDMSVQSTTGMKTDHQRFEFSPTVSFLTTIVYTIISFGIMIYKYRQYF